MCGDKIEEKKYTLKYGVAGTWADMSLPQLGIKDQSVKIMNFLRELMYSELAVTFWNANLEKSIPRAKYIL